jgi:hypothetical protein
MTTKQHLSLSLKEIKQIYACPLTGSEEVLKDRFVIGCITGLLSFAYLTIGRENLRNGRIKIEDIEHPQPTRVLPIHYLVKEIFQKYNYQIPEVYSKTLRKDLQRILQKAKINEKIIHIDLRRGIFTITPKHKLIQLDMTRAFALQNLKKAGLSQDAIYLAIGRTEQLPRGVRLNETKLLKELYESSYFKNE